MYVSALSYASAAKKDGHTLENWMKMSEGVPNIVGFMYTTWSNYFQDMPGFFKLVDEYPKWATGAASGPAKDH